MVCATIAWPPVAELCSLTLKQALFVKTQTNITTPVGNQLALLFNTVPSVTSRHPQMYNL